MKDPITLVKDTTAWTIGRVCQLHYQCLSGKLNDLIRILIESLEDEPRVAAKICWVSSQCSSLVRLVSLTLYYNTIHFRHQAIHNLAELNEEGEDLSSPLSQYFKVLVEALLKAADRDDADESFLRSAAYEALNLLIQNSAGDVKPAIAQLLPHFLERLQKTFAIQITSSDDRELQVELQGHLCGSLQACTQKLEGDIKPHADVMMTLFLKVFESQSATVQEEALMAVGAVANGKLICPRP